MKTPEQLADIFGPGLRYFIVVAPSSINAYSDIGNHVTADVQVAELDDGLTYAATAGDISIDCVKEIV